MLQHVFFYSLEQVFLSFITSFLRNSMEEFKEVLAESGLNCARALAFQLTCPIIRGR